ncbi:MAG: hypothetical protein J6M60_05060 [Clostridia bacterium]|nr:hypothetical protein [Clostridia bacterium]
MKNLSSWLIAFFIIAFWVFRVIVAITGQMGVEFMSKPYDNTAEIVLLFVVLALVPFIFKRKIFAALGLLVAYGWYFGFLGILPRIMQIINGETIGTNTYMDMFFALIGITLAIVAVFDILFDKARMKNPVDKETDWFYKNEQYDRKLDERADKNNYKTL